MTIRRRQAFLNTVIVTASLVTLARVPGAAAQTVLSRPDIFNGDFETGDLTGWTAGSINGGIATTVREGTCFSANDSRGTTFNGVFSGLVRSSGPAPVNSVGIMTSAPFVARSAVTFRALSENSTEIPAPNPVTFEVRLLDAGGSLLQSQVIQTNVVTLPFNGCIGSTPGLVNGLFSEHAIDTSAYAGQLIRVEFRQHTNVNDRGFFTLVDDVQVTGVLAPSCTPPPAGLVSWWTANGTARDSVGSNDGALVNGASFAPGLVGEAFSADGVDDGIIVPSASNLNFGPGADLSIDVWLKANTRGTASQPGLEIQTIVDKRLAPGTLNQAVGYALFLSNGKLGFQIADVPLRAGFAPTFISSGPDLRDGTFHHVAVTVHRNLSNGGTLYVDGLPVLSFDPTVAPGDLGTTEPLRIGVHATTGFNGFFKGLLDELEINTRALSAGEIQDVFLAGRAGKCGTNDLSELAASLASQVADLMDQNAALQASLDACRANEAQLTSQVATLIQDNLALQTALETANATITQLTTDNATLTQQISSLQGALNAANATIGRLTADNSSLTQQVSSLQALLNAANGIVAQQTALVTNQMTALLANLRSTFGDQSFVLPDTTPFEQLQQLINAVLQLNRGRKEGVFVNLGGRP